MTGVDGGVEGTDFILCQKECPGTGRLEKGWRERLWEAGQVKGRLPAVRGPGMGCGRAHGEMPPNMLVSPSFQPHLHGAGGMWALPAEMVSAVHASLCLSRCPVPALPDLFAVLKERGRGRKGSICPGTSAHQP